MTGVENLLAAPVEPEPARETKPNRQAYPRSTRRAPAIEEMLRVMSVMSCAAVMAAAGVPRRVQAGAREPPIGRDRAARGGLRPVALAGRSLTGARGISGEDGRGGRGWRFRIGASAGRCQFGIGAGARCDRDPLLWGGPSQGRRFVLGYVLVVLRLDRPGYRGMRRADRA
jgi:hypothetical protein